MHEGQGNSLLLILVFSSTCRSSHCALLCMWARWSSFFFFLSSRVFEEKQSVFVTIFSSSSLHAKGARYRIAAVTRVTKELSVCCEGELHVNIYLLSPLIAAHRSTCSLSRSPSTELKQCRLKRRKHVCHKKKKGEFYLTRPFQSPPHDKG
jgi:hypothetical protein